MKTNKTEFVWMLPKETQLAILEALAAAGIVDDWDVWAAMNSRLCDLEDTIDIREFI